MDAKKVKKQIRKEAKAINRQATSKEVAKLASNRRQGRHAKKAVPAFIQRELASGSPLRSGNARMFAKAFTDRHASILAWMLTVTDPFGVDRVHSIPPILAPGIPMSPPRIYRYVFHGFATANSVGRLFIGANADMWLPNPSQTALTVPQPMLCYLGNSTTNAGNRGSPVHYTSSGYIGTGAGSGFSYPAPGTTNTTAGVVTMPFPDQFIPSQINLAPASANAMQRAQQISLGLRARPVSPATGQLQSTGALVIVQQVLGDTVQTNPAAANSPSSLGGADAYQWVTGLASGVTGATTSPLTPDQVAISEWDLLTWPKVGGAQSWLTAAAIPNQSCSLQPWVPTQNGTAQTGFPQLAVLGVGLGPGAVVEFEASYVYAFYGAVSYEVNVRKGVSPVPTADLEATVSAASGHMRVGDGAYSPARSALASVVQPHIDSGDIPKSSAADWVKSGSSVIEAATGSSVGDLIGEGLGFLGAMLL